MVIPLAMLAILAFVVIRSLMGVVAREAVPAPPPLAVEAVAETALPLRALAVDDGRALLLPAAGAAVASEDATVDLNAADANAS